MYFLYILKCKDKTLYTGITTDLKRRVIEHNTSPKGAKYTRGRRPVKLVFSKRFRTRSKASRVEAMLKGLTRKEKMKLVRGQPPTPIGTVISSTKKSDFKP